MMVVSESLVITENNQFRCMATRMLRRKGFYREKGKSIFTRHTVGVGGVYVELVHYGYRLTAHRISKLFVNVTGLREALDELDEIDRSETISWREQIAKRRMLKHER